MATEPEFFTRRVALAVRPDAVALVGVALLAAIDAALAPAGRREGAALIALRALRDACFETPGSALVGLCPPLDAEAFQQRLGDPLETWLPLADQLDLRGERLMFLG